MKWWRGPHVPIVLILVILLLDYTSYRRTIRWQWPVAQWTMYDVKSDTDTVARFRRFVVEHRDGRREEIGLGHVFAFLDRPYRLDRGLKRNLVGFLEVCLRALYARHGDVALTYEKRKWNYGRRSLEKHYARDAAVLAFRLVIIDMAPETLLAGRPTEGDLLGNGNFRKTSKANGWPHAWEANVRAGGIGIEAEGPNRALLLSVAADEQSVHQVVTAPAGAVRLVALARTTAAGAAIELETAAGTTRAEVPADGAWHAIEVLGTLPAAGEAKVTLRSAGAADVFFDDVALYPEGG